MVPKGAKQGSGLHVLWLLIIMLIAPAAWADADLREAIATQLRLKIEAAHGSGRYVCQREIVCGIAVIPAFYAERNYQPVWVANGSNARRADALLAAVQHADQDGLNAADYHLDTVRQLQSQLAADGRGADVTRAAQWADLDLLLTDAYLLLASHLFAGRVNPEKIHSEWYLNGRRADMALVLQKALAENRIGESLAALRPPHSGYSAMRRALNRFRDLSRQGGWPSIDAGPSLRPGESGPRIAQLRARLRAAGDLNGDGTEHDLLFDAQLETAVLRFQQRHGLKMDGIVGRKTRAALNVPVEKRLRQIELNLERWRWIPHALGQRYILVNIADFKMVLVQHHQPQLEMRVIVGRDYRRTPVFSAEMKYIVLNPRWTIPPKIAREDILPRLQQEPDYLHQKKIRVYENWQSGAAEADAHAIDWSQFDAAYFPFKLVQEPGLRNALGRVKFVLPNKFAIFLHDTPAKGLFDQPTRDFSSGCIRLEEPVRLVEYLLDNHPRWDAPRITALLDSGQTKGIRLSPPIPVHLLYWTAWAEGDGTVYFRDDIYERDDALDQALNEKPPAPAVYRARAGQSRDMTP
jgi:murein L,D-transpeptidase YcbB/YkuD